MSIIETTKDAITLEASVSFNNPTEYSAMVPFADINILSNGTYMVMRPSNTSKLSAERTRTS